MPALDLNNGQYCGNTGPELHNYRPTIIIGLQIVDLKDSPEHPIQYQQDTHSFFLATSGALSRRDDIRPQESLNKYS